ncbi:MAG: PTS sugar transporter subunit IIA [Candidatus Omnitrophica bacterium]|nr:PTS sugar transporter subunit IIA [Candidatus Omnitrophota bacterium]
MALDLLNYLDKDNVVLKLKGKSKRAILSTFIDHLISVKKIEQSHKREILKFLTQREDMGSTAIGGGIALPHARLECVKDIILCIGLSTEGLEFESLDGEPVYIVVLLLSNQKEAGLHLKMLALLARILRDKYFVQNMKNHSQEEEVVAAIKKQQSLV